MSLNIFEEGQKYVNPSFESINRKRIVRTETKKCKEVSQN